MKTRIVNVALLLATIVGAFMTVSTARKLHGLQADYDRLVRVTGELTVTDPTQMHMQAIPTDEPFHFAWRVYAPAGQITLVESIGGNGSSGTSTSSHSQPREFIARIRIDVHSSGATGVYTNFGTGFGHWTVGASEVYRFLETHRNELKIEQLAKHEPVRIKPGEHAALLRVEIPDSLAQEVGRTTNDHRLQQLFPFECRVDLE